MLVSFALALTLALVSGLSPAFFSLLASDAFHQMWMSWTLDVTSSRLPLGWTDTAASHPESCQS